MSPYSIRSCFRPVEHGTLDALFFTGDSKEILLLYDKTVIYCCDLDGMAFCYRKKYPVLVQGTILHRPDTHSPILAFTGDYDPLEWKELHLYILI